MFLFPDEPGEPGDPGVPEAPNLCTVLDCDDICWSTPEYPPVLACLDLLPADPEDPLLCTVLDCDDICWSAPEYPPVLFLFALPDDPDDPVLCILDVTTVLDSIVTWFTPVFDESRTGNWFLSLTTVKASRFNSLPETKAEEPLVTANLSLLPFLVEPIVFTFVELCTSSLPLACGFNRILRILLTTWLSFDDISIIYDW